MVKWVDVLCWPCCAIKATTLNEDKLTAELIIGREDDALWCDVSAFLT